LLAGEEHVFCLSDANVTAKAGGLDTFRVLFAERIETKPEAIFCMKRLPRGALAD